MTGAFTTLERRDYYRTRIYRAAEWVEELDTHSDHRLLDPDVKAQLYREVRDALEQRGDRVEVRLRTHLFTATTTASPR